MMIIRQRYRMRRVLPLPLLAFQLHDAKVLLKEENRPTFLLSKYGQLLSRIVMAGRVASVSDTEKVFRLELEDPTGTVECLFFKAGLFSHPEAVRDEMSVLHSLSTGDQVILIGKVRYEQYKDQESTRIFIEQITRVPTELITELYERAITELRQTIVRPPAMPDVYLREAQAYYGKIQNFLTELQDVRTTLRTFYEEFQKSQVKPSSNDKSVRTTIASSKMNEQTDGSKEIERDQSLETKPARGRARIQKPAPESAATLASEGVEDQVPESFVEQVLSVLKENSGRSERTVLTKLPNSERWLNPCLEQLIQDGILFINQENIAILL